MFGNWKARIPVFGAARSAVPPEGSRSGAPRGGLSSYSNTPTGGIDIPSGYAFERWRFLGKRTQIGPRRRRVPSLLGLILLILNINIKKKDDFD